MHNFGETLSNATEATSVLNSARRNDDLTSHLR